MKEQVLHFDARCIDQEVKADCKKLLKKKATSFNQKTIGYGGPHMSSSYNHISYTSFGQSKGANGVINHSLQPSFSSSSALGCLVRRQYPIQRCFAEGGGGGSNYDDKDENHDRWIWTSFFFCFINYSIIPLPSFFLLPPSFYFKKNQIILFVICTFMPVFFIDFLHIPSPLTGRTTGNRDQQTHEKTR